MAPLTSSKYSAVVYTLKNKPQAYTPGLGPLVFRVAVNIRILLCGVGIRSGRRAGEMSPVPGIRVNPVPVPLSGVRWRVALLPVRLRIPVVVLSVFGSVMA